MIQVPGGEQEGEEENGGTEGTATGAGLLLRRRTRQTRRQQFANATGKGEVAARAGPQRPRAFRGVLPTAAAASWHYDDPGSAGGGRACTRGGGRPTCRDHPHTTIYQQQRRGGGGRM